MTDVVSKLFSTRTQSVFPCRGCLGTSSSWMHGADCWPASESGTENILASHSSSESQRPLQEVVITGGSTVSNLLKLIIYQ